MTPERCAEIHAVCFTVPRPWSAAEFADLLVLREIYQCDHHSGFSLGRIAGPEAELLTLAVLPEARRQGLGKTLLSGFEAVAKKRGAEELFLEVAMDNAAAIQLYKRAGFTQCGRRKDYYESPRGPKLSAAVYKKQL